MDYNQENNLIKMSRAVIQPFEEYQRARVIFVQTVAALAGGKDNRNVELLKRLDAIRLLGPLLTDPVISIKQYAALAIGTLAGADEEIASQVVNDDNGHILNLILNKLGIFSLHHHMLNLILGRIMIKSLPPMYFSLP